MTSKEKALELLAKYRGFGMYNEGIASKTMCINSSG
jgi:hypothetical protein